MKKFRWLTSLMIVFALALLVGCAKSPSDTVKAWHNAIRDGNVKKANEYSTSRVHTLNELCVAAVEEAKKNGQSIDSIDIVGEEIHGDKAVVTYKDQNGQKNTIDLVKQGDEWKVDVQK